MTPPGCRTVQDHLLTRGFTEGAALPPALAEHARGCAACAALVRDFEAMQDLVARAQAEARALPDLPPAAWARIRASVEGGAAAPPEARWGRWGWSLAATVALAVTGWALWVGSPAGRRQVGPASVRGAAVAGQATSVAGGGRAPARLEATVGAPADEVSTRSASEAAAASEDALTVLVAGQFAPGRGAVIEGATLETASSSATVHAFGRHLVRFAPHSVVRVAAWEPDRVELDVQRGSVRCDVERARGAERFVVRAGDAEVRVLGTIFTVTRERGEVSVTVQRGRVAVAVAGRAAVSVGAGERWARGALWTGGAAGPSSVAWPLTAGSPAPSPSTRAVTAAGARAGRRSGPRAVARTARREAKPVAPAPRTEAAHVEHVVEIQVPDQQAGPPAQPVPSSVRKLLVPVVATIRQGGCDRAVPRLRAIAKAFAERSPPDVLYLLGWCYRHQGNVRAGDAFFARYRASVGVPRWPLPRGADDALPLPSSARLAP